MPHRVFKRFALTLIVLVLGVAAGCASPRRESTAPPTTQPVRQSSTSAELLKGLSDAQERAVEELEAIEHQLAEFARANPQLGAMSYVIPARLQQVTQALVAAELATIDMRAKYAPNHPAVRAAEQHENELTKLYERELHQYAEWNTLQSQHARLSAESVQRREFLRRLRERILHLELTIDAERAAQPT
jgi:hypothetical protein